ncbi:MAG: hypothetical protein V3S07_09050 [Micropepsaceae bacterium]
MIQLFTPEDVAKMWRKSERWVKEHARATGFYRKAGRTMLFTEADSLPVCAHRHRPAFFVPQQAGEARASAWPGCFPGLAKNAHMQNQGSRPSMWRKFHKKCDPLPIKKVGLEHRR